MFFQFDANRYIYIYRERERERARERERNVHFVSIELNIINETVRMDQTLELPTFIIHQIMSYLSAKEVARTRILSKRWNQINANSLSLILIN